MVRREQLSAAPKIRHDFGLEKKSELLLASRLDYYIQSVVG